MLTDKKDDLKEIVQSIGLRPAMYLRESTYSEFVAFIHGYDCACDYSIVDNFRNWLSKEKLAGRAPSCLTWISLVLKIIFPDMKNIDCHETLSVSDNLIAIKKLSDLLNEFLSVS